MITQKKGAPSVTNITDNNKRVKTTRQLTQIKSDPLATSLKFSVTSKKLSNKDIIATIEDAIRYLETEEADSVRIKISHTFQTSKPSRDNPYKNERNVLQQLQSDTSNVILIADKSRYTFILNREDYLEKFMGHIDNGRYQLPKKDPTSKIKAKLLKQLKALKDNSVFI